MHQSQNHDGHWNAFSEKWVYWYFRDNCLYCTVAHTSFVFPQRLGFDLEAFLHNELSFLLEVQLLALLLWIVVNLWGKLELTWNIFNAKGVSLTHGTVLSVTFTKLVMLIHFKGMKGWNSDIRIILFYNFPKEILINLLG